MWRPSFSIYRQCTGYKGIESRCTKRENRLLPSIQTIHFYIIFHAGVLHVELLEVRKDDTSGHSRETSVAGEQPLEGSAAEDAVEEAPERVVLGRIINIEVDEVFDALRGEEVQPLEIPLASLKLVAGEPDFAEGTRVVGEDAAHGGEDDGVLDLVVEGGGEE